MSRAESALKGENESDGHYQLKRAALAWLHSVGARSIGFEVSVLTSSFERMRVDVGAYDHHSITETRHGPRGGRKRRRIGQADELIAVECKAARADFLKDSRRCEKLEHELGVLDRYRERLEGAIRKRHPHLRARTDLFDEKPVWCYERAGDAEYDRVVKRSAALAERLQRGTKFERLRAARLFHRHWICAAEKVARVSELPAGWGLLVVSEDGAWRVAREAERDDVAEDAHLHVLERLAQAGTRALIRESGLRYGRNGLEPDEETDDARAIIAEDDGADDSDADKSSAGDVVEPAEIEDSRLPDTRIAEEADLEDDAEEADLEDDAEFAGDEGEDGDIPDIPVIECEDSELRRGDAAVEGARS